MKTKRLAIVGAITGAVLVLVAFALADRNGTYQLANPCASLGIVILVSSALIYVVAGRRLAMPPWLAGAMASRSRREVLRKRVAVIAALSALSLVVSFWLFNVPGVGLLAVIFQVAGVIGLCSSAGGLWSGSRYIKELEEHEAGARPNTAPPIWPPRKPEDWGRDIEFAHRQAMRAYHEAASNQGAMGVRFTGQPPIMPPIPSWEVHNLAEQARDPRQVRWARGDQGEWVKVEWGNSARLPPSGVLPVFQSMQEVTSGLWKWVMIGEGAVSLDWQEGPARFETFSQQGSGGRVVQYRRPLGTAGVTPTPLPIEPGGEHGDSREQSVDDLVKAGIVAPR